MREDDFSAFNKARLMVTHAKFLYFSPVHPKYPGALVHAWKYGVMDDTIETKVKSHA